MPEKTKSSQKSRDHKVGMGTGRGAKRNPQTMQALIMMNKGVNHRPKRRSR